MKTRHEGHVSVCVCQTLYQRAGECGMIVGPHSTKLPQSWDTESDQLGVPARFSKIAQFPTRRSGCLGVQVFHECSKTYLLQTQRFSVALHDWFSWLQSHRCFHLSYKCVCVCVNLCSKGAVRLSLAGGHRKTIELRPTKLSIDLRISSLASWTYLP